MVINRIKSGIPGLDKIFKGGMRENSSVLVSGGPGTGKTIMGMQFLLEGAKRKEPGLCLLYDAGDSFAEYAKSLGIDLEKYVKSGLITIIQQPIIIKKIGSLAAPLELIKKKKIKRVFLDSITMFSYVHVLNEQDYRREIVKFLKNMENVTLMATAENPGLNIDDINFRAEDFLFDGVIHITKVRQEASFERVLHVSKMRGQEHLVNLYPFFIKKGGIEVFPDQLPFSLMALEAGKQKS
ncbi:MAG: hypothetical protein KJ597_00625 [Nanoarchaeota archaeon]|nr:hypothetical protein [Nanoarchaeota archaeon]MBU1622057.1 hypothetical protein [Nanoarchaeota archaeon]